MTEAMEILSIISWIIIGIVYIGLAISKLVIHSKWSDEECPVEDKLQTYLLWGGIADVGWIILCIISPCFGFDAKTYLVTKKTKVNGQTIKKEQKIKEEEGCGSKLLMAAFITLIASFVFWCLGNAWILNKYQQVDFSNTTSSNYCYPPLFKGAFSLVIISDGWYAFLILTIIIICIRK